jgi:hypothetical protein
MKQLMDRLKVMDQNQKIKFWKKTQIKDINGFQNG